MVLQQLISARDIADGGTPERAPLGEVAAQSAAARAQLAPDIPWLASDLAGGQTFCVDLAANEAGSRQRAEISGFAGTAITPIAKTIDPTTERAD
ncbi:MAG: DUF4242 domain-containing protein [Alphaproteobacteria bacterium]